jgi:hypothetical protein
MSRWHIYLIVGLLAFGMACLTIKAGYDASVEKARIAAEAQKFKSEQGHKFKFGLTKDRQLQDNGPH